MTTKKIPNVKHEVISTDELNRFIDMLKRYGAVQIVILDDMGGSGGYKVSWTMNPEYMFEPNWKEEN